MKEPNIDQANGIHFGFTCPGGYTLDAFLSSCVWPEAEAIELEFVSDLRDGIRRAVSKALGEDSVEDVFHTGSYEGLADEIRGWIQDLFCRYVGGGRYDQPGYLVTGHSGNTLAVERSPYYTWTTPCSPVCPNGGDLDTPAVHPDRGYPWEVEVTPSRKDCPRPPIVVELAAGPDDPPPLLYDIPSLREWLEGWRRSHDPGAFLGGSRLLSGSRIDNPLKTYCLGHEWYEEENAPYPVFDVVTDQLVQPGNHIRR